MKRREFVKNLSVVTGGIFLSRFVTGCNISSDVIRFGISSDIHKDIMHDASWRLKSYLKEAKKQNVDFIIDLGDFCHPTLENNDFLKIWDEMDLKKYRVLGNHDMDKGSKQDFMNYVGMDQRYYSFDQGNFHFIVLDPNNLLIDGKYVPYGHANFYRPTEQRAHVDPQQLEWLRRDLENTDKHCLVFSHQSFENPTACQNRAKVREIFESANKLCGFKKVVAAFSGHDHTDYAKEINGICYVQINSMSNQWVGDKHKCPQRFSPEINKNNPYLQYTTPYKDPLFAIVTINNGEINIDGIQSSFIEPGPDKIGLESGIFCNMPLVARVSDRVLKY